MDKKITNKIVNIDDIIHIAEIMRRHDVIYKDIDKKENPKKEDAEASGERYYPNTPYHYIKYSVDFASGETVNKENEFNWFRDTVTANPKEITSISLYYYASHNEQRESTIVTFYVNRVNFECFSTNMYANTLADQIEQFINSLPPRMDETIVKDTRRTFLPALCISLPLGLVLATILLIVCRVNVLPAGVSNVLSNGFVLTGIFLLIAFLAALLIPTENTSLYHHFKFEKKYVGHDKNYNSIYQNDYADFKSKCEVAIGENYQMPLVRRKINENYKRAFKILGIELIVAVVAVILFFVF